MIINVEPIGRRDKNHGGKLLANVILKSIEKNLGRSEEKVPCCTKKKVKIKNTHPVGADGRRKKPRRGR